MDNGSTLIDVTPRQLNQLEREIYRLDICLEEKPSPAIRQTLERERDGLVQERDLLLMAARSGRRDGDVAVHAARH
jgi:hypothetical protein